MRVIGGGGGALFLCHPPLGGVVGGLLVGPKRDEIGFYLSLVGLFCWTSGYVWMLLQKKENITPLMEPPPPPKKKRKKKRGDIYSKD